MKYNNNIRGFNENNIKCIVKDTELNKKNYDNFFEGWKRGKRREEERREEKRREGRQAGKRGEVGKNGVVDLKVWREGGREREWEGGREGKGEVECC